MVPPARRGRKRKIRVWLAGVLSAAGFLCGKERPAGYLRVALRSKAGGCDVSSCVSRFCS